MQEDSIFQRVTSTEGKHLAWEKSKIKKKKRPQFNCMMWDAWVHGCVCVTEAAAQKKRE